MKQGTLKWIAVFLFVFAFDVGVSYADALDDCRHHIKYGAPSTDAVVLCRTGYVLSHDGSRKVPRWVAYHMTKELIAGGSVPRSDDFRADPDLPAGQRSELSDYRGSGFDRGHMAAAEDMSWDELAMSESFLLSNMAPQVGAGFNNGIWKGLENRVRKWAVERDELYVVTGPIYRGTNIQPIGGNAVNVPTHFYKVIFDPIRVEAIAFVLPNASNPTSDLPAFITSVREVEQQTGLNFHPNLEDSVEKLVEEKRQPALW